MVRGTPLPGGGDQAATTLRRTVADQVVTAPTPWLTVDGPDGAWPLKPSGDGRFTTRLYAPGSGGYSAPGAAVGLPPVTRALELLGLTGGSCGLASTALRNWMSPWPALAALALTAFLVGLALQYLPERLARGIAQTPRSVPS